MSHLADKKQSSCFIRSLYRHRWVVYAKPPFGGPEHLLNYLARYTHRVAISNHRLLSFDGQNVTFLWKDYAHGNKKRKMTATAEEFLRRFLLHVLPPGFVRIRHYGLLANRRRTNSLALCRELIGDPASPNDEPIKKSASQRNWTCPKCSGPMMVIERLTVSQMLRALSDERCVLDSLEDRLSASIFITAVTHTVEVCLLTPFLSRTTSATTTLHLVPSGFCRPLTKLRFLIHTIDAETARKVHSSA